MVIAEWLRNLGLERYAAAFRDNDVDSEVLPQLTGDDLMSIGVTSVGHRRKLLAAIAALGTEPLTVARSAARATSDATSPPTIGAERRQLTVMFCDLVGSTALSTRLDPEDLRELIGDYHRAVSETVGRSDGFVAKYMGDGVLIYFGYPRAHEDDAERAVRAGLAVIETVGKLPTEEDLSVRLGIATGIAVVGDLIGEGAAQERGVIGETPNRAARLQGLAAPNSVVIDATTRQHVGRLFECLELGPVELKGLSKPVQAWRVLGESAVESRFEALRAIGLAPLIGRAEELELLVRRWQMAQTGDGQVVLLAGEAGIGKSRLTASLRERISGAPHVWVSWFCSPHYQHSAYHPIIAQLERAAGFQRADTDETRWAKLGALLAPTALSERDEALLGNLLSLSGRHFSEVSDMSPEQRRRRTTEALLRNLTSLARQQPVVAVFEDTHWADPSSRDLLDRLIGEIAGQAVLLVLTFRPEFLAPWTGLAHVTSMLLNGLGQRECAALVREIASAERPLPADIVGEIIARTDGIPLFVEELTRAALEAGAVPGSVSAAVASVSSAVPASLHASLMARLDRLGPEAREVAQIGAVIGREFQYELLTAVAARNNTGLHQALDRLTEAGLVSRRGMPPAASFLFKHALIQDVAYGTLLRARRQQLHAAIGHALVDQFPEQRESQPEIVAYHFTEAGQSEQAVAFWLQAGRRSAERSADREAIRQLQYGLNTLITLPASDDRDRLELSFLLALSTPLWREGTDDPQVRAVYVRATALSERLGDTEGLIISLNGQRICAYVSGETHASLRLAQQCLTTAARYEKRDYRLLGHFGLGVSRLQLGELQQSRLQFETAIALYDPGRDDWLAAYSVTDLRAIGLSYLSLALWALGYPEQARRTGQEALRWAHERQHPYTTCQVGFIAGLCLAEYSRDVSLVREYANTVMELAIENDLAHWRASAMVLLGWAAGQDGNVESGVSMTQQGIAGILSAHHRPYVLKVMAELEGQLGNHSTSLRCIEEAHRHMQETGQHLWHAELCRVQGEVNRQAGGRYEEAERCFAEAIAWARQQEAKSFELRAAMSIARLWLERDRRLDARDLLIQIYGWFTEGFDTADLKEAKALIDALA